MLGTRLTVNPKPLNPKPYTPWLLGQGFLLIYSYLKSLLARQILLDYHYGGVLHKTMKGWFPVVIRLTLKLEDEDPLVFGVRVAQRFPFYILN